MPKDDVPTQDVAAAPDEFPQSLRDFCCDLSLSDKRVEMIAAFDADERAAGRLSDLPSQYRTRYQAFCVRPSL